MFGMFFDAKIGISDALISCLGDRVILARGKISTSCLTASSDAAESQGIIKYQLQDVPGIYQSTAA